MSAMSQIKKTAFPRPSMIGTGADVPDLVRDPKSHVVVSDGGRDRGPEVRRGINGGKRPVHDFQVAEIKYEQDKAKHYVNKVVDPLRDLHRRGSIDDTQLGTGIQFQDDFDRARWESASGMRFDGMPASGKASNDDGRTDSVIAAREDVIAALRSVGGAASIGGMVLIQVIGQRRSINDLASDSEKNRMVLRGALECALSTLKTRYERIGR